MSFGEIPDPVQRERQLDYNRAIAQKIRNRLQQLDNATEKDKRRWVWELLQNAKDSLTEGGVVDIKITVTPEYLEFSHNGGYFSPRNITNLVHQISSKEGVEGSIGRFGTGFLTTHTLSKKVEVEGVYCENKKYYKFKLLLDRSGSTEAKLVKSIENSWEGFKSETIAQPRGKIWTQFKYFKPDKKITLSTLKDFETFIHFNLAFVPEIGRVTIVNELENTSSVFEIEGERQELEKGLFIYTFLKQKKPIYLLLAENEQVSVAIEVNKNDTGFEFKHFEKNVPRLFCAFPLIGTEEFNFPLIINSVHFVPKTERDMLYLKGEGADVKLNQNLLLQGVDLYKQVVSYASQHKWKNFFVVANTRLPKETDDLDSKWYESKIQKPIRDYLSSPNISIVETESDDLIPLILIKENKNSTLAFFPSSNNKETRENIWKFSFELYPRNFPKRTHIHEWYKVIWEDRFRQTIEILAEDVKIQGSILELSEQIEKDTQAAEEWLNEISLFFEKEAPELFDKYEILPNQKGVFKLKKDLYEDKGIPNQLKKILKKFGTDWKEDLLHSSIKIKMNSYRTVSAISDSINAVIRKNKDNYSDDAFNQNLYSLISLANQELSEKHKKIWEFSRAMYLDEVREKITILPNAEKFDWKESLHWQVQKLVRDISELKYVETLQEELHGAIRGIDWLAGFIDFILHDEEYKHFLDDDENPILPNQNGMFYPKSQLFLDDGSIPEELKEALRFFNPGWLDELLDTKIYLDLPANRTRTLIDIAEEIDKAFKNYHESKQEPGFISAYRTLSGWLKEKEEQFVRTHFDWIFRNKADLALGIIGDEEEREDIFIIIESGMAHLFSKIANHQGISEADLSAFAEDPDGFRQYIDRKKEGDAEISEKEWLQELNNRTGQNFSTISELIQKLRSKKWSGSSSISQIGMEESNETAKEKIRDYLKSQEEYDVTGWRETSKTIIEGVKKKGISIRLVTKGANFGNIILDRMGKEKEALKDTFCELWVNREDSVFQITLGEFIEEWDIQFIEAGKFDFH